MDNFPYFNTVFYGHQSQACMKLPQPITAKDLAEMIGADLYGESSLKVEGINEIHQVEPGDITFVDAEKYYAKSLQSAASLIIIDKAVKVPVGKALLVHPEPFKAYNNLVQKFRPFHPLTQAISETAKVHPTAVIEPGVIIGHHVEIGANCYVQANASIRDYAILKDNVTVQNSAVIGSDAFYFQKTKAGYRRWRTGGRVVLEEGVDIGAGCTINSGVSGDTIIGKGSKLDCLIQIGHDVRIGANCLIAAQVGIAGNTVIGDRVTIYGQVGVAQNLKIGDDVIVYAKSGVSKNLEAGKVYWGAPATETREKYREIAALRHLPDFFQDYYK